MSRILIVDDDEPLGRSMARLLQREGHECTVAGDLRSASVGEKSPELILIEVQPGWLGLLADFRSRLDGDRHPRIPLVITTGRRELFRRVGPMLEAGDDLLAKPFDTEELVARVEVALRRARPA
jgi:DNA-binding response OmpR family regulator